MAFQSAPRRNAATSPAIRRASRIAPRRRTETAPQVSRLRYLTALVFQGLPVLRRRSAFSIGMARARLRTMLKALILAAVLVSVGCSYVQMQPKGNEGPPAPAAPRLP